MKTWFLIPTVAFCYNLRNTTDEENGRKFQLRSSIDVKLETESDNFGTDVEIEIEKLLCQEIFSESENCKFVDSGWLTLQRSIPYSNFRSRK